MGGQQAGTVGHPRPQSPAGSLAWGPQVPLAMRTLTASVTAQEYTLSSCPVRSTTVNLARRLFLTLGVPLFYNLGNGKVMRERESVAPQSLQSAQEDLGCLAGGLGVRGAR